MDATTNKKKLLTPFQHKLLEKSLQQQDLPQSYRQRIHIMLLADEGKSQAEICQTLGCCPATVRHWIHIARAGMAHQWQDCPIGRPKKVNDQYLERLKELVSSGSPRDCGYCVERWTAKQLSDQLVKDFGVKITDQHINRLLKQMGLSTRQKASNSKDTNNPILTGKHILITNIQSENNIPDSPSFLLMNLALKKY